VKRQGGGRGHSRWPGGRGSEKTHKRPEVQGEGEKLGGGSAGGQSSSNKNRVVNRCSEKKKGKNKAVAGRGA